MKPTRTGGAAGRDRFLGAREVGRRDRSRVSGGRCGELKVAALREISAAAEKRIVLIVLK